MKNIILIAILLTSSMLYSQDTKEIDLEKNMSAMEMVESDSDIAERTDVDFRSLIINDMKPSEAQMAQMKELNQWTRGEVSAIEEHYKMDKEVYDNKVRLILQSRDAKLEEVLSLEQYAIYLDATKNAQSYDTKYKSDDLKMKREKDGTVKVKTDDGKIKIDDNEVIIKNEEADTKTKIKSNKIKYKDEENDVKMKVKDDKTKVKTDDMKAIIEDDEAIIKKDDVKIKIDDVEKKK